MQARSIQACVEAMKVSRRNFQIDAAERELERFLAKHAKAGLPELVLVKLLREYAITIETIGYIPRTWGSIARTENKFSEGRRL